MPASAAPPPCGHLAHEEGIARCDEVGVLRQVVDRNHRRAERHRVAVAEYLRLVVLFEQQRDAQQAEIFVARAVDREDAVAVAETHLLAPVAEDVAVGHVAGGEVALAPFPTDAHIDGESQDDVHQYAADHDQQALPGGFASEFVGSGGALQLLGVHALVDHAGEFHIAAEGNPADSVACSPAGERYHGASEEELELLYAHPEKAGEEEVSQFVYDHQQRKAEDELQYLDEYLHKDRSLSVRGALAGDPSPPGRESRRRKVS